MKLFGFFWTSKYSVLFEVIGLLKFVSLLSKWVLFPESACFNTVANILRLTR